MSEKIETTGEPLDSREKSEVLQSEYEYVNNGFFRNLFQRKTLARLREDAGEETNVLKRDLSAFDLTMVGIGAIIGTGIFVLSGHAAADSAGPAVIISFVIAAIASGFAALSYSEMTCMIPVSGSAYTYSYATMGEFLAWIIGWDLMVEYLFGAATVSTGWSSYVVKFLKTVGATVDERFTTAPVAFSEEKGFYTTGGIINLPAIFIVAALTIVLCAGIRQSKIVNNVIVGIKVLVVILFILAAAKSVNPDNWKPFVPENTTGNWREYGASGIFAAAQTVFFAYIGFDAVSTAAQEARRPQRDLPIGIIASLLVCTVLYVLTSMIMTGVVPYPTYKRDPAPIATATMATGMKWLTIIVSLGAIAGLTSVMLILLLAQTRIFYTMAHDGMLPLMFARVNPRTRTPLMPTVICGIITALLGAFLPVDVLGNMTSVGTLLAFILVHIGIVILRFTQPDLPRKFKIPGPSYTWLFFPIVGSAISLTLIILADKATIWRVFVWLGIGVIVYLAYSYRHSRLRNKEHDEKLRALDAQARGANFGGAH
ncbi:uncharacterized protein VTP21DRAFT_1455 [Calcarisporiella thermophila]|uniref:uncharacterized protein n=1 Tax=Calcarisporiella thermophila TaxID=911321 RepID=UPI0037438546